VVFIVLFRRTTENTQNTQRSSGRNQNKVAVGIGFAAGCEDWLCLSV